MRARPNSIERRFPSIQHLHPHHWVEMGERAVEMVEVGFGRKERRERGKRREEERKESKEENRRP